tara:strand:+ start:1008 stop:1163 length:156 start_codon:yes stop_codon:yes gene_type:complete
MELVLNEAETSALGDNNEEVLEAVKYIKLVNNAIIGMEEIKEEQGESNEDN